MKSPNISDLIDAEEAELTDKILDYYDGDQEEHLIKLLNCPNKGRKEWQSKGIIPRTRNIMKMIVDKSGLLFNDKAPALDVYSNGAVDEVQSAKLQAELEKVDWVEFFTNFDSVVRMLKTACVLVQYDSEYGQLTFDILTQQNCGVVLNSAKHIDTLVYRTLGEDADEVQEFRVFTRDLIQDIRVDENGVESILQVVPNPFGIIPIAVFHDTNTPRTDFWNEIPTDLIQVNEMFNLYLTDSEYSASWNMAKTIVTNAEIESSTQVFAPQEVYGQALPRLGPVSPALTGGPGRVITLNTQGIDTPFFKWDGPEVNFEPIDNMFNKRVADFAADWAVNVKDANGGVADSGFKLIVEEMPNLELRKKRQRMFEAGFKRLFRVIKAVLNTYHPGSFTDDSELFAQFSQPSLPVDQTIDEQLWSRRIAEGRASRVDYFMEKFGMSRTEAIAKIAEIDADNAAKSAIVSLQKYNVTLGQGTTPSTGA
jgi:hypothetical protein